MHEDFEYVESLEKEIDELESEKADFSNIYDLLLEECVSKDVICSYLHSLSDLNAHTGLQCLYLHKVKECECLAQKLSKQLNLSVNKTNVSDGSSKQVTQQNLPQNRKQAEIHSNVLKPGMYRIATSTTQNREAAPFLNVQMTSVHISSGLVLHQMTSDHNRSELGIQDHSNEQSSSKLVPKVVVRLGINPMIQPEPEDLPKDNPKLEIAVLSSQAVNKSPTQYPCDICQNIRVILLVFTMKMEILLESTSNKLLVAFKMRHSMRMLVKDTRSQDGKDDKDSDKGSKSRSQSMKEQAYNKEQRERPRPHELNDESNLIDLMKECHQ
ncbi:hypothetical protein Tco_0190872 [Tanacetum coccineum]